MTPCNKARLPSEVLSEFDIKNHVTSDLLITWGQILYVPIKDVQSWPDISHLLPDCISPKGVPILAIQFVRMFHQLG